MNTQEQLETVSDRELEITLDKLIPDSEKSGWKELEAFKYCSNPNDIMPLVIEHRIDLSFGSAGYCQADSFDCRFRADNTINDIYRAATIVLILLLQGEE